MAASTREEIVEVFDALDTIQDRLLELNFDVLTTPERLAMLDRLETIDRRMPTPRHALINNLRATADKKELGGTLSETLANRLRITKPDASRRIAEAADLGYRRTLGGEPLEPVLEYTAAAQRQGLIGDGHIKVVRDFFKHLPADLDPQRCEEAETQLAEICIQFRPDEAARYARQLAAMLHPDGNYSDQDRARKRGITLGKQQYDGMSTITGHITPQLRAAIEALDAKYAAPGINNPGNADNSPADDPDAARRDTRSQAQRNHDALLTGLSQLLASGELGTHRGLPVTVIVTTTITDLEAAAAHATGSPAGANPSPSPSPSPRPSPPPPPHPPPQPPP
ncbi:DUF222 domain-containing protein, partial [Mycobacterium sp.]|uniref:DUF222 domain-containing protein n=1 Tax=Mycobacterium sp. TaxID=1785 RepID=UPI003A885426